MKFYENDLEGLIWDKLHNEEGTKLLIDRGLDFLSDFHPNDGITYSVSYGRQTKIGSYGITDIIQFEYYNLEGARDIYATIIELKAVPATTGHVLQLARYVAGMDHWISDTKEDDVKHHVDGVLIAKDYDSIDDPYFLNYINKMSFFEFNFSIDDGINFERKDFCWQRTDPQFPEVIDSLEYIGNRINTEKISNNNEQAKIG